jgi:hypothetical protein
VAKWFAVSVETVTWAFRIFALALPPLVGYVVYRLMKALAASGADRFTHMPLKALRRS